MPHANIKQMQQFGCDFWNDSCDARELQHARRMGAVGATSNPVIVANVLEHNKEEGQELIDRLIYDHPLASEDELVWQSIHQLGQKAAKILEPVFEESHGEKGQLSLQVSPRFYRSAALMTEQGIELARLAPNIAIKIPASAPGLRAIEALTAKGISVNATVSFSVAQALACAEAIERGLKQALNRQRLSSYVTLMVGRVDDHIGQLMQEQRICVEPGLVHWAGIAVFKKTYQIFRQKGYQACLLAAAYRHHLHWSELIGRKVILSMPYKWWTTFNDSQLELSERINQPVDGAIIENLCRHFSDFRRIYEDKAMHPADFVHYAASRKTLQQFLGGLDRLHLMVRERMLVQP